MPLEEDKKEKDTLPPNPSVTYNKMNPMKDPTPLPPGSPDWRGRPNLNIDKNDGPIGFPSYDGDNRKREPHGYFPEPQYKNKLTQTMLRHEENIEDFEADKTYSFPKSDMTEEEAERAKAAGYVYITEFKAGTDRFCCGNCEYMVKANTTTGYWCRKFKFPDRPEACSDGFEPK
jgi:hypothetical protein